MTQALQAVALLVRDVIRQGSLGRCHGDNAVAAQPDNGAQR